jgi:DsbC/DsbD-like thiol-disulfide interchange protein
MSLLLSASAPDRTAIEQAMAKVPRWQAIGEQTDLSVLSAVSPSAGGTHFVVTVRAPAGSSPVLFAEGPDNWYFSTSKVGLESSAVTTTRFFTVTVEEKPKEAAGPVPLSLTLVAGDKAIETQVSLDGNGLPR